MTAACLTELEITREPRLPDKIGRIAMATRKMQPSFRSRLRGKLGHSRPGTCARYVAPSADARIMLDAAL
jgi:hypothetical protein